MLNVMLSLKYHFKGTTRGLSGVFLPLAMNPLCHLKYYDRSITSPWVDGFPWPI